MNLADDDHAAIAQVLNDYYRAFSTLDAQAVVRYFHEPSQLVSPAGVVPTPTRAAVTAAFQPVMDGLRSRHFAKSELINLHLKRLSANTGPTGAVKRLLQWVTQARKWVAASKSTCSMADGLLDSSPGAYTWAIFCLRGRHRSDWP